MYLCTISCVCMEPFIANSIDAVPDKMHRQSHLAGGTDVWPNKRCANRIMPMHQCESIAAPCNWYNAGCLFANENANGNGKGLNGQIGRLSLILCTCDPSLSVWQIAKQFFCSVCFDLNRKDAIVAWEDACHRSHLQPVRGKADLHSFKEIYKFLSMKV